MLKLINETIKKAGQALTMRDLWREAERFGDVEVKNQMFGRGQVASIHHRAGDGVTIWVRADGADPEAALFKAVATCRQIIAGDVGHAS